MLQESSLIITLRSLISRSFSLSLELQVTDHQRSLLQVASSWTPMSLPTKEVRLVQVGTLAGVTLPRSRSTCLLKSITVQSHSCPSSIALIVCQNLSKYCKPLSLVPADRTFCSGKQQTQFLQNFLKNHANMSSPALPGGVTIATAQGHLPAYHGTAAASLSPAMLNLPGLARNSDVFASKLQQPVVVNGSTIPVKPSKPFSENSRPLSRAIPIVRPPDSLDAEGYVRLIHNKQDATRTGTGPVMGSDW